MSKSEIVLPPSPPAPAILRRVEYENEKGFHVVEREVVSGVAPPGYVRFIGTAHLDIKTSQGVMRQSYLFPIDADTLARAFVMFESCAQAEGMAVRDRMIANARRQANPLLDPSGRPIT